MERVIRLGHAEVKCQCGNIFHQKPEMKYLYECIVALQTSDRFVMRSSHYKLSLAEAILGMLAPMKIKELDRKVVTEDGKQFVDIFVAKG